MMSLLPSTKPSLQPSTTLLNMSAWKRMLLYIGPLRGPTHRPTRSGVRSTSWNHSHRLLSSHTRYEQSGSSVKSCFWSSSLLSTADQIVEFFSRSRSGLRRDAQCACRVHVECSLTSDNITLDPQPCCNYYLCNPCWCPFHCITRVCVSRDRVSCSFPHSSTLFNSCSLRSRHSTALHCSSANALSPLHLVTVYVRPQDVYYSTVSRS